MDVTRSHAARSRGPQASGRVTRRRRLSAGMVLPVTLALLFVMLTLALGLAEQGRAVLGFTVRTEADTVEIEANEIEFSSLQAVLQGDMPPAALGLPGALPTPSGPAAAFHQPAGALLEVLGSFNAGAQPSLYNVRPADQVYDGYEAPATGAGGVPVPKRHVIVVSTARYQGMPSDTHASLYSSDFPCAILAPNGAITVNGDLFSASSVHYDATHPSGVPVTVSARGTVHLNRLHGRALSLTGPVTASEGGILLPGSPVVDVPADFTAALAGARSQATSGLISIGPLIDALHSALHRNIPTNFLITATPPPDATPVSQTNPGSTDINTLNAPSGTDLDGSTFNCGVDFVIPSGMAVEIPYSCKFAKNLALNGHSVLRVRGDLEVSGNLYVDKMATLAVDGKVTVTGRFDTVATETPMTSLEATLLALSDVNLAGGMQHTPITTVPTVPFSPRSDPFSQSTLFYTVNTPDGPVPGAMPVDNPNNSAFDAFAAADMVAVAGLVPFFQDVTPLGAASEDDVPGALLVTDQAFTCGGTRLSALVVASGGVTVNATRPLGALWSRNGSVTVSQDFLSYPYFTHAFVHSAGADSIPVGATRFHRTAFGRFTP